MPGTSLAALSGDIVGQAHSYGSLRRVPVAATPNMRNDMCLTADAVRLLPKATAQLSSTEAGALKAHDNSLNAGTRFIPGWVKVAVAVALGLGTRVDGSASW